MPIATSRKIDIVHAMKLYNPLRVVPESNPGYKEKENLQTRLVHSRWSRIGPRRGKAFG
jgi:hypothetical protein